MHCPIKCFKTGWYSLEAHLGLIFVMKREIYTTSGPSLEEKPLYELGMQAQRLQETVCTGQRVAKASFPRLLGNPCHVTATRMWAEDCRLGTDLEQTSTDGLHCLWTSNIPVIKKNRIPYGAEPGITAPRYQPRHAGIDTGPFPGLRLATSTPRPDENPFKWTYILGKVEKGFMGKAPDQQGQSRFQMPSQRKGHIVFPSRWPVAAQRTPFYMESTSGIGDPIPQPIQSGIAAATLSGY
ncbi:hypothetical protein DFP72DRAFT_851894 [Ephemerocybe angulata]|uniref:Uncharacterized protein n=1 Tax=Ephemerocybe angulata TaxID=980116 RepID=A0A8H6HPC9_9AGAR|nr:hypothetical protein DFP72DRAFT_851894 [Tulosesus angulatus]